MSDTTAADPAPVAAPAEAAAPAATTAAPAKTEAAAPAAVPVAEAPAAAPAVVEQLKTKDADAIKLFVGQIPRHYTAEAMLPYFEPYGAVFEWSLLIDRMTGLHKGCGFLTYKTRLSALAAMDALHDKQKIEGANRPIQVKPADSEQGKVSAVDETENTKLFVGMLARSMEETGLKAMFSVYGAIEDAMILKNLDDGSSKGCGFVKFSAKASCIQAIAALHGQQTTEGNVQPLVVKFADTPREKAQRRQQKMQPQQQWGGQQGYQQQQQQWGQQAQQMGMYGQQPYAQQAQQTQQAQQMAMYGQQAQAQMAPYGQPAGMPAMGGAAYGQQQQGVAAYGQQAAGGAADQSQQSYGPDGGNLFLYHLPNEWTDIDVINAFSPYGRVVSAKVFIDKATGLSKCFGFVSYDNNVSAANAIQSMNGFQVAPGKRLRVQLKRPKEQGGHGQGGVGMQQQQFPQKPY